MWLKVVPDSAPNANGRWIEVADQEVDYPKHEDGSTCYSWLATERVYRNFVPPGEHMVAVRSTPPSGMGPEAPYPAQRERRSLEQ